MTIPGSASPLLLRTAAAAGGYAIERSLRFNSADSAYLSRTPASAGNRKTWTWAGWVKRSTTALATLFGVDNGGGTSCGLVFSLAAADSGKLEFFQGGTTYRITTQVFRDLSAWMHIVLALDTTSATAANRVRLYVNGAEVTAFGTNNAPSQNADLPINNTVVHSIGSDHTSSASRWHFNGYLADVHFIDGQALDPTSFGEFDDNGIWQPIDASGLTYGTNGFHLDFADNASTTTIGYDAAGSNDWTANNLSVTAGAGNDSLVDVPTNGAETDTGVGGEVRGNYCTLNPTLPYTNVTLSNGNLDFSSSSTYRSAVGTIGMSSGKWYFEMLVNSYTTDCLPGITNNPAAMIGSYVGSSAGSYGYSAANGQKFNNASSSAYGNSYGAGDVIGIAFDADNGELKFYKNGTVQNSGTAAYTGLTAGPYFFAVSGGNPTSVTVNFGQRPFAYAAPSGFKALNTANLPAPVVTKPSDVMDVALYTGNNTARSITGLGFSPDFVWIKGRSGATDHALYDIVRGAQLDLVSNSTAAETTQTTGLTAFNSDGFSIGTLAKLNTNAATYVAWAWDAGTTTDPNNTDGSISSQVRANATAGFSVVTYTGTGSAETVGHGLGVSPSFVIVKSRSNTTDWQGYHIALGQNYSIQLHSTSAAINVSNYWNGGVSSTIFGINGPYDGINFNGYTYVAYCFAPVAGYSAFGSYTGNGSSDGPLVYLGFRPALVIVKMSSSTGNWTILDSKRAGYNVDNDPLFPNLSNAEGTTDLIDITSNGFKVRTTDATFNTNAGTYIYAAFAEHPFQYARAR